MYKYSTEVAQSNHGPKEPKTQSQKKATCNQSSDFLLSSENAHVCMYVYVYVLYRLHSYDTYMVHFITQGTVEHAHPFGLIRLG